MIDNWVCGYNSHGSRFHSMGKLHENIRGIKRCNDLKALILLLNSPVIWFK